MWKFYPEKEKNLADGEGKKDVKENNRDQARRGNGLSFPMEGPSVHIKIWSSLVMCFPYHKDHREFSKPTVFLLDQ